MKPWRRKYLLDYSWQWWVFYLGSTVALTNTAHWLGWHSRWAGIGVAACVYLAIRGDRDFTFWSGPRA